MQVFALGLAVINCTFPIFCGGHHQSTIRVKNIIPQLKLAFAQRLVYQLAIGTTKISLCCFYLRLFMDRRARVINYTIIGFVTFCTTVLVFSIVLSCIPTSDIWSLAPQGRCTGTKGRLWVIYASGCVNILTDIILLVFAIPRICKSQVVVQS